MFVIEVDVGKDQYGIWLVSLLAFVQKKIDLLKSWISEWLGGTSVTRSVDDSIIYRRGSHYQVYVQLFSLICRRLQDNLHYSASDARFKHLTDLSFYREC